MNIQAKINQDQLERKVGKNVEQKERHVWIAIEAEILKIEENVVLLYSVLIFYMAAKYWLVACNANISLLVAFHQHALPPLIYPSAPSCLCVLCRLFYHVQLELCCVYIYNGGIVCFFAQLFLILFFVSVAVKELPLLMASCRPQIAGLVLFHFAGIFDKFSCQWYETFVANLWHGKKNANDASTFSPLLAIVVEWA